MKYRYFAAVLPLLTVFSCSKPKQLPEQSPNLHITADDHAWYCFTDGALAKTSAPQDSPIQPERPWTEAVRISSASCAAGDGETVPSAYAVVNRTGILVFKDNEIQLFKDENLFTGRTAGTIIFENDTPLFSLYKSTFFNDTAQSTASADVLHPFLAQFDSASHISYPVISCPDLGLGPESEITDYIWDGSIFVCSVKTATQSKIAFSYLTVQPKAPLLSLTPANAKKDLFVRQTDKEAFRSQKIPKSFNAAPERIRKMLSGIPASTAFYVTCYTAGGHSPRLYLKQQSGDETTPLNAYALLADTYACVMFNDGTTYISGSLFGRHIIKNGKTTAFLLPKLPSGYEYSAFTITGTSLYAAWEETSFYKTARSGFISLNLDQILYGSIGDN